MNEVKRKLISNQSSEIKTKKFRNQLNQSVTCIEDLSNEIFYEIFDYLEGCEIVQAFSSLNYQIQEVFNCSSLLFKIKLYSYNNEEFLNKYSQFLFIKKHQIFSIDILFPTKYYKFFSSIITDPAFDRLESIVIQKIQSNILISLLVNLACLPRLFALTIDSSNTGDDLKVIYQLIFALPMLKYNNFIMYLPNRSISLPIFNNKQFSPIENLVINHSCNFNELLSLISYTPELRRLTLYNTSKNDPKIKIISSIISPKLTQIHMYSYETTFYEFEISIPKISSNLQILSITTAQDIAFLDAQRWEQLILQSFPQLKKFYLTFYDYLGHEYDFSILIGESNEFSSSFWVERQWMFETEFTEEDIRYKVRPYSKRWYEDTDDNIINWPLQLSETTRLTITYSDVHKYDKVLPIIIKRILGITKIYYLDIPKTKISIPILVQVINLLPDLCILKIHSLSLDQTTNAYEQELLRPESIEARSKIIKVYLEEINDIQEFDFLLKLCSYMTDFNVRSINNMDIQLFLRSILKKINDNRNAYLRSICFHVPVADDQMVEKLGEMIKGEKILVRFSIKRVLDNIFLKWNDFSSTLYLFSHK